MTIFKKITFMIIFVVLFLFVAWILLLFFTSNAKYVQKCCDNIESSSSLIVVLTGGKGRIEKGLQLFENGYGKLLVISGVFKEEKIKQKYLKNFDKELIKCCIFFEDKSRNTLENASEVRSWLERKKLDIKSIQLVTSYYHMPRSQIIFKKIFPNKKLKTVPVEVNLNLNKQLFFHFKLIFSEFFKSFLTIILLI